MTRAIVALLGLAALVAWAVLRREPMPTARLWREPFDEPGGGWER